MSEDRYEPLQRLATLAPPPPPALADAVLARARRRRGGLAAVLASTATVVAVVVGTLVLGDTSGGAAERPVAAPSTSWSEAPHTDPSLAESRRAAAIAATGLRQMLTDEFGNRYMEIWVSTERCARVGQLLRETQCGRWSAREQRWILDEPGLAERVTFAGDRDLGLPYAKVGALRLDNPGRGRVVMHVVLGGRACGVRGYVVERQRGDWQVTGRDPRTPIVTC